MYALYTMWRGLFRTPPPRHRYHGHTHLEMVAFNRRLIRLI